MTATKTDDIKLAPSDFFADRIFLSENWVGSTHWSIKKDLVANGRNFLDVPTATAFSPTAEVRGGDDEALLALCEPQEGEPAERVHLIRTAYLIADAEGDGVLFQSPDSGGWAIFDRKYVDLLHVQEIYGPTGPKGVFCDKESGEPNLILMSCDIDLPPLPAALGEDLRPAD